MNAIITDFSPGGVLQLRDGAGVREADFERIAVQVLRVLYPNCDIFRFSPTVSFEGANWSPDVAIVERRQRYWFVIEVEIATHHLEKHVVPQVRAFVEGQYGDDATNLLSEALDLPINVAATLLHHVPRYVGVVSNRPDELWTSKLQSINVQHIAISSYHSSDTNQTVHATSGFLIPAEESIGFGRVRATDNAIVTRGQRFWKDGDFKAIGPEGIATWTCTTAGKQVWLMKKAGLIEFPDDGVVQILRRSDRSLLIRLPYPS